MLNKFSPSSSKWNFRIHLIDFFNENDAYDENEWLLFLKNELPPVPRNETFVERGEFIILTFSVSPSSSKWNFRIHLIDFFNENDAYDEKKWLLFFKNELEMKLSLNEGNSLYWLFQWKWWWWGRMTNVTLKNLGITMIWQNSFINLFIQNDDAPYIKRHLPSEIYVLPQSQAPFSLFDTHLVMNVF